MARFTANTLALLDRGEVTNLAPWQLTWRPAALYLAGRNSLSTRRAYGSALRTFLKSGPPLPLDQVTEAAVLAYKADLVNRGLSPRTIRCRLIILQAFFDWCIDHGYHRGPNPVIRVPLPRAGGALAGVALDQDQVARLVDAAGGLRDRALLAVMCAGGLRSAEACALQQRDVHFSGPAIVLAIRSGKGGRAREVILDGQAHAPLMAYMAIRAYAGPTTWLFQPVDGRAGRGRPLSYVTVYQIVTTAAMAAGLGHVTPHDLRRTAITLALDNGGKLPEIQRQAGHAKMSQTAEYYRVPAPRPDAPGSGQRCRDRAAGATCQN